ncbi:hypothetical protein LCFBJUUZ_CDS0176 [Staphylococcus phage PG-2021_76]
MLVIINSLHTQIKIVEGALTKISGSHIHIDIADNLETAIDKIDYMEESTDELVVLAGFIFNHREVNKWLIERGKVIFVSDIGTLPVDLITVEEHMKHYSLMHQLLILLEGNEDYSIPHELYIEAKEATNWFNLKTSNKEFLNKCGIKLDLLKEKCYNKGNVYLIYENDPSTKILLAHHILDNLDKGIVIVGSQTRSSNDIMTFYCKGINMEKLTQMFGEPYNSETNIFSTFIPSQVDILGNNILKFIKEGNN